MTPQDLTQLGIGGAAIGGMVVIVKEFLKSSREKDVRFTAFIMEQEKNFVKIVGNHMDHNTKAFQSNEKTTSKLVNAIDKLINKLK